MIEQYTTVHCYMITAGQKGMNVITGIMEKEQHNNLYMYMNMIHNFNRR